MTTAAAISNETQRLISELGVTVKHFSMHTGIPAQSLTRKERLEAKSTQSKFTDVRAILQRVSPWFDSHHQAWAWYIGQPIAGFGNLTPSEMVKKFGDTGVEAVNDFITSKELGGFE